MNVVPIVKMVTGLAVSAGVGSIVTSAAKLVAPPATGKAARRIASKISVTIGAAVLSGMVADQAVKYTEEKIDGAVEAIKNASELVESAVKEN